MSKWEPRDNTDAGVKVEIRRRILKGIEKPSVLDCFAVEGKIYRAVYQGMPYVGLDEKEISDGRHIISIDNRLYLRSSDLSKYNVFDLDAYGSPWHQFLIILKRRKVARGESLAIFLTDGLQFNMSMSNLPSGMKHYVGLPVKMNVPSLNRHEDFIRRTIVVRSCDEAKLFIREALIGENPRGNMKYIGLLLKYS